MLKYDIKSNKLQFIDIIITIYIIKNHNFKKTPKRNNFILIDFLSLNSRTILFLCQFLRENYLNREIENIGKVVKTDSTGIHVLINRNSSCSGCSASGACNMKGEGASELLISGSFENIKQGDSLRLKLEEKKAKSAIFLAYLMPLILLFTFIFLMVHYFNNELLIGLSALFLIGLYFTSLIFFRTYLKNNFKINIEKANLPN